MKTRSVVTFGEVMMRLSSPAYSRLTQSNNLEIGYGGSEANVAVGLRNFGIPAVHVTRFPDNDFGQAAAHSLQAFGVDTSHIIYGKGRMGLYFSEKGSNHRSPRIIYDRSDSAFSFIQPGMIDWNTVFKGASRFHWSGITPAISQGAADVCFEAIKVAHKMGLKVSGDINYRRNLWTYGKTALEVMPPLIELTHLVVADTADMTNCTGISGDSFESSSRQFIKAFSHVEKIAAIERITVDASHSKIKGVLWSRSELITSTQYDITQMVDRVGAGDAFMAGLIYGEIAGKADDQTIEFANASCALKHTIEGDVNRVSVEEVEALVKGENVGKLLR